MPRGAFLAPQILDAAGKIIKQFRVSVSAAGFKELMDTVGGFEPERDQVIVGIKSPNDIAAKFLISAGCTVYALNP